MTKAVTKADWIARAHEDLAFVLEAKTDLLAKGIRAGWRRCHRCGQKVHFRLMPENNHVRSWCDTPGCLRVME